jgi:ABC-2 type transport system ATP-binding protein
MGSRRVAVLTTGALLAAAVLAVVATRVAGSPDPVAEHSMRLPTSAGIVLDTSVFVPAHVPAPAVLLAHGFGGSKAESRGDAQDLARHGFLVMTWSARGFGASTGEAGVDAPGGEVSDVSRMIDALAQRHDVVQDAAGDPRVGIAGPSYGGGVSLLAAALDPRIDALAPQITWSDMVQAFAPQSASGTDAQTPGVIKSGWASIFFGLGTDSTGLSGVRTTTPTPCPGFTSDICTTYADLQKARELTASGAEVLRDRSTLQRRITAPTLLMQGERDTLFPLEQATSLAQSLHRAGTPVKLVWLRGGHDGGFGAETARVRGLTRTWFDRWLKRDSAVDTGTRFEAAAAGGRTVRRASLPGSDPGAGSVTYALTVLPGGFIGTMDQPGVPPLADLQRYGLGRLHDLAGTARPAAAQQLLSAPAAITFVNPPGALPGALSSLPGLGQASNLLGGLSIDLPGQSAVFEGPRLVKPVELLGGGELDVRLTSSTGELVAFVKLYDVSDDGTAGLPDQQLAPIRLRDLPSSGEGHLTKIRLPQISTRIPAGHRLRIVLASTDQAYLGNAAPASYTVAAGPGTGLTLPTSPSPATGGLTPLLFAGLALLGLLVLLAALALVRGRRLRRRRVISQRAAIAVSERTPPLEIIGLTKTWSNGLTAVDEVTLTVAHGEILGLLGPNGAGKTTTLRMALGLIHPTAGEVRIFGTKVSPGSPALERVGAFVEGPGFLPHLSGMDNLQLWWRSTGASWEDAQAAEAIAIAGLGSAIERSVKSYSQGMRQRLAIAQSMLGNPDLVILDEPTNGLDPPQIVEMRRVIRSIAERGATVVVSSHLLAEVEQTCTSVAVMSRGRLVAQGSVADVVGADRAVQIELVSGLPEALALVRSIPGVGEVEMSGTGLLVRLEGAERSDVLSRLVSAGFRVTGMAPRRALEETFLELVS